MALARPGNTGRETQAGGGSRVAALVLVLVAIASVLLLLFSGDAICAATGTGGGAAASACPLRQCPACPQAVDTAAAVPRRDEGEKQQHQQRQQEQEPTVQEQQAPGQEVPATKQQSTAADPVSATQAEPQQGGPEQAAAVAFDPDGGSGRFGVPQPQLLCGGPDAVPPVVESLNTSTIALWEGVATAFEPYVQAGGYSLHDVEATAAYLKADQPEGQHVHGWVENRGGKIAFPHRPDGLCGTRCDGTLTSMVAGLQRGMDEGRLRIPEGLPLLLSVDDQSHCNILEDGSSRCSAPVFGPFKTRWDRDIVVPHFKPSFEPASLPWSEKSELAFFRGASICSDPPLNDTRPGKGPASACVRWTVAQLSWDHPHLLNSTIMHDAREYKGPNNLEGPPVPRDHYKQYKYLLNLDGSTATWRMATLMQVNSLILFQKSTQREWYYHALKPCEQYLEFWVHNITDVIQLLEQLRAPHTYAGNQAVAQRIMANSQAFAFKHLTNTTTYAFWQKVIDNHAALYKGDTTASSGTAGSTSADGGSGEKAVIDGGREAPGGGSGEEAAVDGGSGEQAAVDTGSGEQAVDGGSREEAAVDGGSGGENGG